MCETPITTDRCGICVRVLGLAVLMFIIAGCENAEVSKFNAAAAKLNTMLTTTGNSDSDVLAACAAVEEAYKQADVSHVTSEQASAMKDVSASAALWKNQLTLMKLNALSAALGRDNASNAADGNEIIMRATATNTGLMYIRPAGGTIADAFATTPISIPLLSEIQGEAIGFDPLGRGYYTTSEGVSAPIHYFDLLPPPAAAMYWDNDGVSAGTYVTTGAGMGGTGTWAATNKWYNGSAEVAWQNGHDAVFWGTAGTVTLGSAQTVNSLSFKTNGYVITGSTLTLGGSGSVTVDAGVVASIGSVVAGTAGLAKNGSGTLVLTGANTYSGGTTINGGVLGIVSSSLGVTPGSPVIDVTINNGSTLRFDANALTMVANRQILLGAGGGVIDAQSFADTIAGVMSGAGSLTKIGAGTLTLSGVNTYTGATTVSAGTLSIGQSLTTSSSLTVETASIAELAAGATKIVKFNAVTINGTGKLDLNDNKMIVSGGADPVATMNAIRIKIIAGRNVAVGGVANGTWDGAGITSSSAHSAFVAAGSETRVLAYALNSALPLGQMTTFGGVSVGPNDILVKYTRNGDASMNGVVDDDDVTIVAALYDNGATSGHQWYQGDFNFDGKIDDNDVTVLAALYDQSQPPLSNTFIEGRFTPTFAAAFEAGQALSATLPEPTALAMLAVGALGMMSRRRRVV